MEYYLRTVFISQDLFHSVMVEKTQFLSSLFSLLLQAGCRKYVEVANRTNHIFLNSYVQVEFAINCNRTNYSNYLKITSKCSFCFPKGKKGSKFLLELRSLVSVNEKKNFNLSKQCTNFHFFFSSFYLFSSSVVGYGYNGELFCSNCLWW